jgi:voltage-gated potassium channel
LFEAVHADMVMHPSSIIANKIRVLLGTPLLSEFESLALYREEAWACELISRIAAVVDEQVPDIWEVVIDQEQAHAVAQALPQGAVLTLKNLCRNPRERKRHLACVPLLLIQRGDRVVLPAGDTRLRLGDRLLFCGRYSARTSMEWTLQNVHALNYILTGGSRPQGAAWRFLQRVFKPHH